MAVPPASRNVFDWVVLNQAQTPRFQRMLEAVSADRRCLLITGTPFPAQSASFVVEPGPVYDRTVFRRRLASWLAFAGNAARRCATLPGHPFVFVTTNPPLLPHLAWTLRRTRRFRYGLLMWDLYPHALVQAGYVGAGHPIVHAWNALNRRALRAADVVVAIGERMAELIREQARGVPVRLVVIPNWSEVDVVKPIVKEDNPFARQHGQLGRVTVMYSGNLGGTHGLDALVDATAHFRDDNRVAFMIIGDGEGRAVVERALTERPAGNLTLLGYQPWETVPFSLATADVTVVSQAKGIERISFPSKVYDALAAGSAILAITDEHSDLADLVRDHDAGVVVPQRSGAAIAAAIEGLLRDPERLKAMRFNARRIAVERFSAPIVTARFGEVLRALIPINRASG